MRTMSPRASALLVVDVQHRLMPAIGEGDRVVAKVQRLMAAARLVDVPVVLTEQNPGGLGPTVEDLSRDGLSAVSKMTFDACRSPGLAGAMPDGRPDVIVAGCEAHVCVLQTVLGLLDAGRRVFVVRDAIGSRYPEDKDTALLRMERHKAEIVTSEMVVFEWLESAEHPRFKDALALVR
jgi:nicotinamidase-related amidase